MSKKIAIEKKIKSLEKINRVTKSMHFYSLVRIDAAIRKVNQTKSFHDNLVASINYIFDNKLVNIEQSIRYQEDAKKLIIVMTSNFGFCGSFNQDIFNIINAETEPVDLIVIGKKGVDFFTGDNVILTEEFDVEMLKEEDVQELSEKITEMYISGKYKNINILHNKFIKIGISETRNQSILPYNRIDSENETNIKIDEQDFIFEPNDPKFILNFLMQDYVKFLLYTNLISSFACENYERGNVTSAALEKIDEKQFKLNIQKNKYRTESITNETVDINNAVIAKSKKRT